MKILARNISKFKLKQLLSASICLTFLSSVFFLNSRETNSSEPLIVPKNAQSGPIVEYFMNLFEDDWILGTGYSSAVDGIGSTQSRDIDGSPNIEPAESQTISASAIITPILSPDNSEEMIIGLINSANTSLDIEQMYIYSSLTDIIDAIVNAYDRGVDVSVIMGDGTDALETAEILEDEGIEVRICDGTAPMYFDLHNKGVIVDNRVVLISSINWSPTSLRNNREAGLIIDSSEVTSYYLDIFNHDWSVCDAYIPSSSEANSASVFFESVENIMESGKFDDYKLKGASVNNILPRSQDSYNVEANMILMVAPDNCFEQVASLLENAQESIDISVYTLSSPYLLDILHAKISEGIYVRLLLEKYPVSTYERNYNRNALYNLSILGSGGNVAGGKWASSTFQFQHCKYAIIDDSVLILSSGNWAKASCPKPQPDGDVDGNRDWWIAISGDEGTLITIPEDIPFWKKIGTPMLPFASIITAGIMIFYLIRKNNYFISKKVRT